ncbi:type VII secretion protein EccCa [Nocardioides hwasunensis]|uniref:type VII secretion protein EccCa n=1 Tax=Nocardioides hwasunensis TaxID=397258 RepID=UPI0029656727|nr:type VII secretion protein EccCa [Nocardioides hwasunensis]
MLDSPPELPETVSGGGAGQALMVLPMMAGMGGMGLMMVARTSGGGGNPIMMVGMGMMGIAFAGMMFGSMGRQSADKRRKLDGDRRDYQRYLVQVRRQARKAADQQRKAALWHHPEPRSLWCLALGTRLWERRTNDVDHLAVRIASGPQRLAVSLVTPETKPVEDLEPISSGALRRFVRTHKTVPDLPVAVSLRAFGLISMSGEPEAARMMTRALIAQLATMQSPDDVRIAVCAGINTVEDWEWLKWLPHALGDDTDAVGQVRLIGDDLLAIENQLGEELSQRPRFGADSQPEGPHLVVILDGGRVHPEAQLASGLVQGVTVVDLRAVLPTEYPTGVLQLQIDGRSVVGLRRDAVTGQVTRSPLGSPDELSMHECATLARSMSRYRMPSGSSDEPTDLLTVDMTLPDLLRLGDPHTIDTNTTWRPRAPRDRLRVPIGVGPTGSPIDLDIKESAQGGMGPHGLVIGATGSGKSELLRTLVLGLAVSHSPDVLNFVLVDFKGGATFASMDVLPHTSAVITNLEDELILVDRMKDAIAGEMVRRQEALRAAGNYSSLKDYEKAREQGADLEPMPSLFIVVDEFSELLSAKPDFIDLFVMIGRLGRSLGVHLLLASQRLEEGKLRGLDTHLSYRIGLRTFSAMESRTVLGVTDAYELPSAPGHGYLKDSTVGLVRFRAAYVSAPYKGGKVPVSSGVGAGTHSASLQVQRFPIGYVEPPQEADLLVADPEPEGSGTGPSVTLMEIMVDQVRGHGQPARQVWLPPLDDSPAVDGLLSPLVPTDRGLLARRLPERYLSAPVAIEDKPFDQRRDPMWVDLASSHAVVVGGPQSGKSTLLRTLISSLSLTHSPREVQFYCIDFGGGTLSGLIDLPHVGSVATRLDVERLRRTVAQINGIIDDREAHFTANRIDSMNTYRRKVASGADPGDGYGDIFLVVDGWGTIRQEHEQLEAQITRIATRGLGFGVHVVISIQRWMELRPALRDLIAQRLELRLGDPAESDIDRRAARNVPEKSPGRGLSANKLHYLTALPRIDGSSSVDDLSEGVARMVRDVRAAWTGPEAPEVRLLPRELPYTELPQQTPESVGGLVPIGLNEDALAPEFVNFDAEPHFLVLGDVESGKSNVLRAIAGGITQRWTPKEAKIITFDYRWGLIGAVTTAHQLAYVTNSKDATEKVAQIVAALQERLAGITIDPTARQAPRWAGPRLFVLIDDYESIAASQPNPLHALVEFLPQARDIGLHLVVARAAGGSGGGSFEPLQKRLKEIGTPGLLLSGSKEEGSILHGQKFEPMPTGRGKLVDRRTGAKVIQTPLMPS